MTPRRETDLNASTPVRLTVSQVCAIAGSILSAGGVLVCFTVWLNTMHEDVQQLKADAKQTRSDVHETKERVDELRGWLMPERIPPAKQAKNP